MTLLGGAFQAVQRNIGALLFYVSVGLAVFSARLALDVLVIQPRSEEIAERVLNVYAFGSDVLFATIIAIAQTVAFSRMGRDIDRPMWRIAGDIEALRLFYKLWLILDLANLASIRFVERAAANADSGTRVLLELLWLFAAILLVPFGASVMFYGRVGVSEVRQAASTMLHQLPKTLLIAFFGLFFGLIIISLQPELPLWAQPALAIVDGYLDCFLFAAMWLVCMYHRDEYDLPEDDDLDF